MAVVRMNKVTGNHLESVVHTERMTNGLFVQLGELVTGETELYNVKVPTVDEDLQGEFLLHSTGEVDPDPRKAGLKFFGVEAGVAGRVYHLVKGDVITLTKDLFVEEPVVGQFVVPQLGGLKLTASENGKAVGVDGTTPLDSSLVFKVDRKTTLGYDNMDAYQIRVIKA